ncbi:hypothetical protein ACE38W_18045 [Chitinophaga sp. Hz27]|uniref:hypothetical protein n=1 Tax=Chitinophaga sp. Hz27 TaxID=3347169 RepID=UPI0035D80E80
MRYGYRIDIIHYPLQLTIVLVFHHFNISRQILSSPWAMLALFSILISNNIAAYYWYQLPIQEKIRRLAFPKHSKLAV